MSDFKSYNPIKDCTYIFRNSCDGSFLITQNDLKHIEKVYKKYSNQLNPPRQIACEKEICEKQNKFVNQFQCNSYCYRKYSNN